MIPLDSPTWDRLQHAYGNAANIPHLLKQLAANPGPKSAGDEPWHTLWSALCHQGDVYTASYAAVPHIVQIASEAPGPIDFSFFLLPGRIEISRSRGHGPEIPQDLEFTYFSALRSLVACAARHANEAWDAAMLLSVIGAIAAAKNQINLADALTELPIEVLERLDEGLVDKLSSLETPSDPRPRS